MHFQLFLIVSVFKGLKEELPELLPIGFAMVFSLQQLWCMYIIHDLTHLFSDMSAKTVEENLAHPENEEVNGFSRQSSKKVMCLYRGLFRIL